MENNDVIKKTKVIKKVLFIVMIFVFVWFSLTVFEYYRVKTNKKPIICMFSKSQSENDNENAVTCYGLFYKYREYYYKDTDELNARELTLFFMPFDRDIER